MVEEFSEEESFSDDSYVLIDGKVPENNNNNNTTTTSIHDRIKGKVYRDMMMVNKISQNKEDGTYDINRVTGRNTDLFAEKTHRGSLSVPRLTQKSIDQLMAIRDQQPYEGSGSIF